MAEKNKYASEQIAYFKQNKDAYIEEIEKMREEIEAE